MNIPTNEFAGRTIAGCELIKELGRGNNGIVYLAHQKKLNRLIACKLIAPELLEDPDFMDNLFSEAANAAKLSHPNIIQALDVGDAGELKYFLMEYVDGESLEKIRTEKPEMISTQFILEIAIQLATAMDYAWTQHKMIHGDIKPSNIMISKDGVLKVGDLGLARSSNGVTGDPSDIMITPLYAAPEVIAQRANDPDQRSDIYSFGIMLYELACGTTPFTGTVEELLESHLHETAPSLLSMNPDMDKALAQFIDSMLAKNPELRPDDWRRVISILQMIHKRLFPYAERPAAAVIDSQPASPQTPQRKKVESKPATSTPAKNNNSWSAEQKEERTVLDSMPAWALPVALLAFIGLALLIIAIGVMK